MGWQVKPLGEVVTLQRGFDLPKQDRQAGAVPIVSSSGVSGTHSEARVSAPGVVTGRYGSIGQVHYIETDFWPLNTTLFVKDFKGNNPRFVSYLLETIDYASCSDKSSVPGVNRNDLHRLRVAIPDLPEQRYIAETLGALDDKIELNRRMNRTLESIARAIFRSWFVDFDPVRKKMEGGEFEATPLGAMPAGWRVCELHDVADVVDCLHSRKPERQPTGSLLLQLANIRDDGLLDTRDRFCIADDAYELWTSRMEAVEGDCVITNVGRVGAVAQIPKGVRAALGRNMTGLRCKPDFPFPTFLLEALVSSTMREEIADKTDTGTILEALNVRNISHLRLVVPTKMLASQFEELIRPLRARMEAGLAQCVALARLRDVLLVELLHGGLSTC